MKQLDGANTSADLDVIEELSYDPEDPEEYPLFLYGVYKGFRYLVFEVTLCGYTLAMLMHISFPYVRITLDKGD